MHFWQKQSRQLILASGSPRRRELLSRMGFCFKVECSASVDEDAFINDREINESIARLAMAKGASMARMNPDALVLSADTVVLCDTDILGKPKDADDAARMLRMLSGRGHQVLTAVSLRCSEEFFCHTVIVTTEVIFRSLSDAEINWYIESNEPYDKAGAYGIQGKAMIFVDKINGCYFNVVGLPVTGTIDLFKAFDAKGTL